MPPALKVVYLIVGSDRPKIDAALERLRGRFDSEGIEAGRATELSGDDAVAACNAPGLFASGGRLVIVQGVERWKAADVKAVEEYLRSPAPETVLALVGEGVKPTSPLAKACAKAGDVLTYDVSRRKLPEWVADQLARRGAEASSAACRLLVELVGDDPVLLAAEADKIATWAGGAPVREADVELLAAGGAEVPAYAVTDAWGRRDVGAALQACETLLEQASEPGSRSLLPLVGLLANHVERVAACQTYAAEGLSSRDAAARLKKHPFFVEKLYAQAASYSTEELRSAVVRLAELDLALKGGSRLSGELELERALVDITAPSGSTP